MRGQHISLVFPIDGLFLRNLAYSTMVLLGTVWLRTVGGHKLIFRLWFSTHLVYKYVLQQLPSIFLLFLNARTNYVLGSLLFLPWRVGILAGCVPEMSGLFRHSCIMSPDFLRIKKYTKLQITRVFDQFSSDVDNVCGCFVLIYHILPNETILTCIYHVFYSHNCRF